MRATQRIRTFLAIAGALSIVSCSDEASVIQLHADVRAPEVVDFGNVQVGVRQALPLELANEGSGKVTVTNIRHGDGFTGATHDFGLSDASSFSILPGADKELSVFFQPLVSMEQAVETSISFDTDQRDESDEAVSFTIVLRGRGVESGLLIEPDPVDFGRVLAGSSKTMDVTITNTLSVPVDLVTRLDGSGNPSIESDGLGRFELVSTFDADRNGSLMPSGEELAAGESLTVQLRYVPDLTRTDLQDHGRWTISNCESPLCDRSVTLLGQGSDSAVACEPAAIDFGQVNPGASVGKNTTCTNTSEQAVTILDWKMESGSAAEFSVIPNDGSATPIVTLLEAGASFEVRGIFSPTRATAGMQPKGAIVVSGRNHLAGRDLGTIRIPVAGEAGGPDIAVLPASVNFGRVAVGTESKQRVLVQNVGYQVLTVTAIDGDVARTGKYSVARTSFAVNPGDAAVVEVSFRPTDAAIVSTELAITSDDADQPIVTIPVTGQGVVLPPCTYTVSPTELRFGIVQVLRSTTQALEIRNTGTNDCLINDVAIAAGSAPAFHISSGEATDLMLAPGATHAIAVDYVPDAPETHRGELTFYISDPNNSTPAVPLHGVGSESALLITPNELDFGQVGTNCATRDRKITIYNTGSVSTRILRVELPAGVTSEFVLGSLPNGIPSPPQAGATLAAGRSIEFSVRYRASDVGVDNGFVHIYQSGQTDPYVVPLFGEGAVEPINEDRFTQLETPEVDILFVIDSSGSMEEEQRSLAENFASFIGFADVQALAYQIAVVSTDAGGDSLTGCPDPAPSSKPNDLDQGACGYFADGSGVTEANRDPNWRIITPDEQPSPAAAFAATSQQGTNGSATEQGLDAAYLAFSGSRILDTAWNGGFLRPDAYLALIFISDEEDQSNNTVDFYTNFFLAIKGFRNTHLFSASAIVGPGDSSCDSAEPGERYLALAQRTGGVAESICTSDWSTALENLGRNVFGYKSRFGLSNQPIPESVEVFIDGVRIDAVVPSGSHAGQVRWTHEPEGNNIAFAPLAVPEPGSEIVIRYRPECL